MRELPHFDPDLAEAPPETVRRFLSLRETASGLLLAVPEYAFGYPGRLQECPRLDRRQRISRPQAGNCARRFATGPRRHLRLSLGLVLQAVGADVVYQALPVSAGDKDSDGDVTNPVIVEGLQVAVAELRGRADRSAQVALSAR